jgi:hypothetical protein
MRNLILILIGFVLVGCSSSNIAKNKTTITNQADFVKVNESICKKYKSTDKILYGCGSATSKSFDLAKSKALLNSKVIVSDSLSNSIVKNESQTVSENSKGIVRDYNSTETGQIFETNLNQYKIVYDKTFVQSGKYRSFIVIAYSLES